MPSILDLSYDITIDICSNWLKIEDVSRLDSAYCIHYQSKRNDFLKNVLQVGLFSGLLLVEDLPQEMFKRYITWLTLRGIQISSLELYLSRTFAGSLYGPVKTVFEDENQCFNRLVKLKINGSFSILLDNMDSIGHRVREIFSNLLGLDFSKAQHVNDQRIIMIAEYCPNLQAVGFSNCNISDDGLKEFAERCPNLQAIDISHCNKVTDVGLIAISVCSASVLKHVKANHCFRLTDSSLIALSTYCPNLSLLHMYLCNRITNDGMITLANGCCNLVSLDVSHVMKLTYASIQVLFEKNRRLETFRCLGCQRLTDAAFSALPPMEPPDHCRLRILDLAECQSLTSTSLIGMAKSFSCLQVLNLTACHKITDEGILAISRSNKQLSCVILNACILVTDSSLLSIAEHCGESVEELQLNGCDEITDLGILEITSQCPHLGSLSVGGCHQITDQSLISLAANSPQLRSLDVSHCDLITEGGVSVLVSKCLELVALNLYCMSKPMLVGPGAPCSHDPARFSRHVRQWSLNSQDNDIELL